MIRKKINLLSILLFIAPGVFAQDFEWSNLKQVTSIQVMNHGGFMVNLDEEIDPMCSLDGASTILIYPNNIGVTNSGARSLLSTALIALTTGSKVNVLYTVDAGYCWGSTLLLTRE